MSKTQLGQFFTTNTGYILENMTKYIAGKHISDPFAGNQDLLRWANANGAKATIGFDVDNRYVDNINVFYNDSLRTPKKYDFVLTNPPYLYQNKMEDNSLLAESKHTDLYQLSLEKIMESNEGIVIVPINFLSSENAQYIRTSFLNKFDIIEADYFTTQVFDDTTYNVMVFYYRRKTKQRSSMTFCLRIRPENKRIKVSLYKQYNWQIGGEFLAKVNEFGNPLKIRRLEESDLKAGNFKMTAAYNHIKDVRVFNVDKTVKDLIEHNTIILKAIDTGTETGKIGLEDIKETGLDALISIKTSRNQIQPIFPDFITLSEQKKMILLFNETLNAARAKYDSLFMTNFRDNNRKRISFTFAYNLLNYVYFTHIKREPPHAKQYCLL